MVDAAPATSPAQSVLATLVARGALSDNQAQQLQVRAGTVGKDPAELAFEDKVITEDQLTQAKAEYYQIPIVDLSQLGASPEALSKLTEQVAKRYLVLPFEFDKAAQSLKVAMANPLDLTAIEFVKQKTGLQVVPHFAKTSQVEAAIAERYARSLGTEVTQALEDSQEYQVKKKQLNVVASQQSNQVIRQAPVAKIVETVISFAITSRASDIHIEPQEEKTRVRYRIDGILHEKLILPKNVQDAVASRIKIMANLKIDEKRIPQDGRISFSANNQEVDLRVSTLPTIHGEKIVMRLLKKNEAVPSLQDLGMTGLALSNVDKAIKIPHGIILVTGPTGSGKTTTLYSILHKINSPSVNIMTLEDPVEYHMQGVNQVQINPQAGLTFASGLRSFLRQDPNIIMVGEIRDKETAELAIQASLTGHLVFSTLHTSSAAGAIPRILDMGAEPFLVTSSLTLIMGQRVARRLNPEAKEAYTPEPQVVEDIKRVLGPVFDQWCQLNNKDPNNIELYRPSENRDSNQPAFKGRIGIYEVMLVSDDMSNLILDHRPAVEIEQVAQKNGMLLMKQDGYVKALDGVTTIEEVLRIAEV